MAAVSGEWAVTRTCLSPKLHGGWVDLYWHGPNEPRVWSDATDRTAVFPDEETARM